MIWKQNVHSVIACAGIAAFGIGAAFIIISAANATDFSYISTEESIIIQAEIQKR